jgi:hypothetical protein
MPVQLFQFQMLIQFYQLQMPVQYYQLRNTGVLQINRFSSTIIHRIVTYMTSVLIATVNNYSNKQIYQLQMPVQYYQLQVQMPVEFQTGCQNQLE